MVQHMMYHRVLTGSININMIHRATGDAAAKTNKTREFKEAPLGNKKPKMSPIERKFNFQRRKLVFSPEFARENVEKAFDPPQKMAAVII